MLNNIKKNLKVFKNDILKYLEILIFKYLLNHRSHSRNYYSRIRKYSKKTYSQYKNTQLEKYHFYQYSLYRPVFFSCFVSTLNTRIKYSKNPFHR